MFVIEVHGRVWHGIAHTILQSLLCARRAHVELARFRSQGSPKSSRDLPSNAGPTNDDHPLSATAVVPQVEAGPMRPPYNAFAVLGRDPQNAWNCDVKSYT